MSIKASRTNRERWGGGREREREKERWEEREERTTERKRDPGLRNQVRQS